MFRLCRVVYHMCNHLLAIADYTPGERFTSVKSFSLYQLVSKGWGDRD